MDLERAVLTLSTASANNITDLNADYRVLVECSHTPGA